MSSVLSVVPMHSLPALFLMQAPFDSGFTSSHSCALTVFKRGFWTGRLHHLCLIWTVVTLVQRECGQFLVVNVPSIYGKL